MPAPQASRGGEIGWEKELEWTEEEIEWNVECGMCWSGARTKGLCVVVEFFVGEQGHRGGGFVW